MMYVTVDHGKSSRCKRVAITPFHRDTSHQDIVDITPSHAVVGPAIQGYGITANVSDGATVDAITVSTFNCYCGATSCLEC